jgi:SAM-dependent methyltransferase
MQERHQDRKAYFKEQGITTRKYVIPYLERVQQVRKGTRVLEIGCGEGGNLTPFIDLDCEVIGIDLNTRQIENAKQFIQEEYPNKNVKLLNENIYDVQHEDIGTFDIIMLRDVIEHIPNQKKFMSHLQSFMKPEGLVFFGFPPWTMPFGGHQQICRSKLLSKLPYFHLLPKFLYKGILQAFGEQEDVVVELLEIKDTGIGINKFQRFVHANNYQFVEKDLYLINPNYEIKFGLKPRLQLPILRSIPFLRDFITTCCYCLIKIKST